MTAIARPDPGHLDVLIIGAGLSGIGAACHLAMKCPSKSVLVLESRPSIGGTWDLFRYPGIRSDSDMYTLGYAFRPWTDAKAIADGPSILAYVRDTAAAYGIDRKIRYRHRVTAIGWSSEAARWTVEVERRATDDASPETIRFTCNFLFTCTGYYDYAEGYTPDFAGTETFQGQIVHPQHWPEALDHEGKRVVVIGSGATAVTLVPALAEQAAHVTMLQRSPSYVVSLPARDKFANRLRETLPSRAAYGIIRWRNVLLQLLFYTIARRYPAWFKRRIIGMIRKQLGPDFDVATHFTPSYDPWDQRLCIVPDADLFRALCKGTASVVTDHIERFTETGLLLRSDRTIDADIIVTATGLKIQVLSGIPVTVDGTPVDLAKTLSYKGMMYSGVPNLASAFGYTNASWTLKADLTSDYVCRLLDYMDKHGVTECRPKRDPGVGELPFLDFSSGYVQRALDRMPRQGDRKPWRLYQNYALDLLTLRFGKLDDGTMIFSRPAAQHRAAETRTAVSEPA